MPAPTPSFPIRKYLFGCFIGCFIGCLCAILLTSSAAARSGDVQYGGGISVGEVTHNADFNNLPGVPKPEARFGDTSEVNFALHGFVEIPLGVPFHAGLRAEYQRYEPQFRAFEATTILVSDAPFNTFFTHDLLTELDAFALEPYLAWREPYWPWLTLGAHLSFFTSTYYDQQQRLPTGTGLVYEFPEKTGAVESMNWQASLHAGLGYDIPIGGADAVLRPSVDLFVGLNNIVEETEWKTWSIRGGVALAFGARPDKHIRRDTIFQRDTSMSLTYGIAGERMTLRLRREEQTSVEGETERYVLIQVFEEWLQEIPAPEPLLTGSVAAKFVGTDGSESDALTLELKPTLVERLVQVPTSFTPMRPSDYNTVMARLDPLYAQFRKLPQDIGRALKEGGHISISYHSLGEKGASALVQAQMLKDMVERNGGNEVELQPLNSNVVKLDNALRINAVFADGSRFLRTKDTISLGPTPVVRFASDIISEAGLTSWSIVLRFNGFAVDSIGGEGIPPSRLDVPIDFAYDMSALVDQQTLYEFSVVDSSGRQEIIGSGVLRFRQGESGNDVVQQRRRELILFGAELLPSIEAFNQAHTFLSDLSDSFNILEFPRRGDHSRQTLNAADLESYLLDEKRNIQAPAPRQGILVFSLEK